MELTFDHDKARAFVRMYGRDAWLDMLNMITELDLHSVSTDWEKSERYCCKAKGTSGDVLVSWGSSPALHIKVETLLNGLPPHSPR